MPLPHCLEQYHVVLFGTSFPYNRARLGMHMSYVCVTYDISSGFLDTTHDDDESELTFYKRFASLLDHLFKNTDIKLCDGETGSSSSKAAKDLNKAIFYSGDLAATYPRKIDLLYKCTEVGVSVELSANEWKKSKTSPIIGNSQRPKNLRVNASILSHLVSRGVCDTLAMEWIGTSGYLYQLAWLPNERVYLATHYAYTHGSNDA